MREELLLTGIVLYTEVYREYDKRLVILTKEKGKITVFANGARRPNSSLSAASQSFVMGKFTVLPSGGAYKLIKVEIDNFFTEIPLDIEKMCYASYFTELMSYYTREGGYCKNNLNLLYFTLREIVNGKLPLELIKCIYEIKLMDIEGQGIHAFGCVKCGIKDDLIYYNAKHGGLMCSKCGLQYKINRKVSKTLVYTLQYILASPVNQVYTFSLEDRFLDELVAITNDFRNEYIDKKFNSLEILSSLA